MDFVTQKLTKFKLSPDEYTAVYQFVNQCRCAILEDKAKMTDSGAVMMGNCTAVLNELSRHFRKNGEGKTVYAKFRIQEMYVIQECMDFANAAAKETLDKMEEAPLNEQEWLDIMIGVRLKATNELEKYEYYYDKGEYEYQ